MPNFKQINDKLGYVTGDRILKKVAETLDGNIRGADILCRWGGDEFGWLLPETEKDALGTLKTIPYFMVIMGLASVIILLLFILGYFSFFNRIFDSEAFPA